MKSIPISRHPGLGRDSHLRPPPQPVHQSDPMAEAEAADIQNQVQQLHDMPVSSEERTFTPSQDVNEGGDVAQAYKEAMDAAVEQKEMQAETLENRLESLLDKQESVLQQIMSRQPGILSLPSQKAKWQSQVQQQQALVSRLHSRLDTVKEIHEGIGLHGTRIEELAAAKVRHDRPLLAEGWDEMREAQRAHENLMRKQAKENKASLSQEQVVSQGMGQRQSLTRTIG